MPTLLSVAACALSILAAPLSHAQGLRVPGSASFGNDWRVGSSPAPSSGYGSSDSANRSYGSPPDSGASRQYGGPSSYGSGSSGSSMGTRNDGTGSSSGGSGFQPSQPIAPRSPGGGLRAN